MIRFFLIIGFVCSVSSTQAQITSTFDTDADGWTMAQVGGTAGISAYQNTGGNPGGYVSATPPTSGGTINTSLAWYWVAPAKFFGEHDFSFDTNIKVDLQQSVAGTDNSQSDIIITGSSGNSIHFQFSSKPGVSPAWTSYSVPLNETAAWHYGSMAGALAAKYQIKAVLANIASIRIRCKYVNSAGYTSGIDNVMLEKRTLEASPTVTSFTPIKALPGASITITGTNFGATPANNIVYFGNVKASVTSASTTQLVVTVPSGATLSPISVINTNTSLVGQSLISFLLLSMSDPDLIGHIIPSSFAPNVLVPYADFNDNGLAGAGLGDIDGDGLLDIVAFEDGQDKFAIFLNQGQVGSISTSSFASKIEIPSGELGQLNSNGTLLADFDNDGKIDIATFFRGTFSEPSGIAISRNLSTPGNISFEAAVRCQTIGISIGGLDAADVDGDGRIDLLVTSGNFYIGRNISTPGKIEFATMRSFGAFGGAVSTGDVNNDGKPEIIVGGSGNFNMLENQSTPGNIVLGAPVVFPGSAVSGVTLADMDSDGKSDIVYYRGNGFNDYEVIVKKNIHTTGSVSLASFDSDLSISTIGRAYSQRVADFNGDAKPDILMAANSGSAGNGFVIFENVTTPGTLSTSSFLPEVYYEETSNGVLAIPLIGDLDGDFKPDIVGFASSDGGEHALILYRNESIAPPHISINTITPLAGPIGSTVTITGEKFSTDPSKNIVRFGAVKAKVLTATKNSLTVEVPAGATYDLVSVTRDFLTSRYHLPFVVTFSPGTTFDATSFLTPVNFTVTGADYDVEVSDLNDDGKPDIIAESRVVTGVIRNYAMSFRNAFTSGPITTSSFIIEDSTNTSAVNLRMIDIDEDGEMDIVSQGSIYRNTTLPGKIGFQDNINGLNGNWFSWADFDLDGKTDLTAVNGSSIGVYRNASFPRPFRAGSYPTIFPPVNFSMPATGGGSAIGDFDNDGFTEFVTSNTGTDNIRVWRNTGGFPFSAGQITFVNDITTGDNPGRIYTGDLDVDGKLDLVLYYGAGTAANTVSVYHNISTVGNITFTKQDFTIGSAGTTMAVADLDGDGKPELIVAGEAANRVSVFKNTSTPGTIDATSFAAPFHYSVTGARGITAADLNGDGKPEIIVTRNPNTLSIFENALAAGPSITITPQPTSTAICEGSTTSFTLTASGTTNLAYQWQQFDGTVFNDVVNGGGYSGATTSTLSINTTGNFGNGDYRCKVSGDLATDKFSNTVTLTVNAVPTAPTTTGSTNCVSAALTLTASGGTNGQYRWYDVATGGTAISGQVNSTYVTPVISTTTTYYASINNGLCESNRTAVIAQIKPLTKPLLTPSTQPVSGTINLCEGDALTVTAPSGFTTYTWSNGASTNPITITTSTSALTLQVTDGAGCISPLSDALNVVVNPFPDAIITPNGTLLTASTGESYQWYQNGDALSGATNQSLTFNVLEYGEYRVEVTENGCRTLSDVFTYLITGLEIFTPELKVYPNPVGHELHVESSRPFAIVLTDVTGRTVFTTPSQLVNTPFNMSTLSSGIYFLTVQQDSKTYRIHLIKK